MDGIVFLDLYFLTNTTKTYIHNNLEPILQNNLL